MKRRIGSLLTAAAVVLCLTGAGQTAVFADGGLMVARSLVDMAGGLAADDENRFLVYDIDGDGSAELAALYYGEDPTEGGNVEAFCRVFDVDGTGAAAEVYTNNGELMAGSPDLCMVELDFGGARRLAYRYTNFSGVAITSYAVFVPGASGLEVHSVYAEEDVAQDGLPNVFRIDGADVGQGDFDAIRQSAVCLAGLEYYGYGYLAEDNALNRSEFLNTYGPVAVDAEPVPEAPAEPVPEAPAEPVPEAPAEPVLEAPAEPAPEAPAEPVPEAPAGPVSTVLPMETVQAMPWGGALIGFADAFCAANAQAALDQTPAQYVDQAAVLMGTGSDQVRQQLLGVYQGFCDRGPVQWVLASAMVLAPDAYGVVTARPEGCWSMELSLTMASGEVQVMPLYVLCYGGVWGMVYDAWRPAEPVPEVPAEPVSEVPAEPVPEAPAEPAPEAPVEPAPLDSDGNYALLRAYWMENVGVDCNGVMGDVDRDGLDDFVYVDNYLGEEPLHCYVLTVKNGGVQRLTVEEGYPVHADGFFNLFVRENEDGTADLITYQSGIYQGYGSSAFVVYHLDTEGNKIETETCQISDSGDGSPVSEEQWDQFAAQANGILNASSCLYTSGLEDLAERGAFDMVLFPQVGTNWIFDMGLY